MKNFKNFTLSTALTSVQQDLKGEFSIEFCEDENGVDWYHLRSLFSDNTWKLAYDNNGLIVAASKDATMLRPTGLSVVEMDVDVVPDDFLASGTRWYYQSGTITPEVVDYITQASILRNAKMVDVSARITELKEAEEDGDITSDELTELSALREYRTKLRRMDLNSAPEINWPEKP